MLRRDQRTGLVDIPKCLLVATNNIHLGGDLHRMMEEVPLVLEEVVAAQEHADTMLITVWLHRYPCLPLQLVLLVLM